MRDFVQELKRRNVLRVGLAYVAFSWLLAQVAELVLSSFEGPSWVMRTILLALALGLPIAVIFAWAFEITAEGVKRDTNVDAQPRQHATESGIAVPHDKSIACCHSTSRRDPTCPRAHKHSSTTSHDNLTNVLEKH